MAKNVKSVMIIHDPMAPISCIFYISQAQVLCVSRVLKECICPPFCVSFMGPYMCSVEPRPGIEVLYVGPFIDLCCPRARDNSVWLFTCIPRSDGIRLNPLLLFSWEFSSDLGLPHFSERWTCAGDVGPVVHKL